MQLNKKIILLLILSITIPLFAQNKQNLPKQVKDKKQDVKSAKRKNDKANNNAILI